MKLFELFGEIILKDNNVEEKIDQIDKKGRSVASTLGNGIATAAKWGTAMVGGATVAVGGLMALTNQTADYADQIDKLSERTGINREELQRWKYAAGQSGADIGKLELGVKTLSDIMDEAMSGSERAVTAFEALGIGMEDLKNKSQEEIFKNVMDSLGDMEQGATRNALGNDLLGRSYVELLPLLNAGSSGMKELMDRADELGLVMSEEAVKANVKFGDTLDDVKQSFGGVVRELTNSALPMIQNFLDLVINNMPMLQAVLATVFGVLSNSVSTVLPFLMQLIEGALPPLIALLAQIASEILPPIIGLFTDILKAVLPPLIDLLTEVIQAILPPVIKLLKIIIDTVLPPIIELFKNIIETVLPPLMQLFTTLIETLLPPIIDLFTQIIDAVLPVLIELFNEVINTVLPPLMELINEIVETVLPPLLDIFSELAELVLPLVITVFKSLLPIVKPIMQNIANIINIILAAIKGDWEGVWEAIKKYLANGLDTIMGIVTGFKAIFVSIFETIGNLIGKVWDGIVNNIKNNINLIIKVINGFIAGLNKIEFEVPDWVPGMGDKSFGINIPTIPKLDVGTDYVPKDMLAYIHRGEKITPAKFNPDNPNNKDTFNSDSKKTIILEAPLYIDGKQVAKATAKYTDKELFDKRGRQP